MYWCSQFSNLHDRRVFAAASLYRGRWQKDLTKLKKLRVGFHQWRSNFLPRLVEVETQRLNRFQQSRLEDTAHGVRQWQHLRRQLELPGAIFGPALNDEDGRVGIFDTPKPPSTVPVGGMQDGTQHGDLYLVPCGPALGMQVDTRPSQWCLMLTNGPARPADEHTGNRGLAGISEFPRMVDDGQGSTSTLEAISEFSPSMCVFSEDDSAPLDATDDTGLAEQRLDAFVRWTRSTVTEMVTQATDTALLRIAAQIRSAVQAQAEAGNGRRLLRQELHEDVFGMDPSRDLMGLEDELAGDDSSSESDTTVSGGRASTAPTADDDAENEDDDDEEGGGQHAFAGIEAAGDAEISDRSQSDRGSAWSGRSGERRFEDDAGMELDYRAELDLDEADRTAKGMDGGSIEGHGDTGQSVVAVHSKPKSAEASGRGGVLHTGAAASTEASLLDEDIGDDRLRMLLSQVSVSSKRSVLLQSLFTPGYKVICSFRCASVRPWAVSPVPVACVVCSDWVYVVRLPRRDVGVRQRVSRTSPKRPLTRRSSSMGGMTPLAAPASSWSFRFGPSEAASATPDLDDMALLGNTDTRQYEILDKFAPDSVSAVLFRSYVLQPVGLEVFTTSGSPIMLTFRSETERDGVYSKLLDAFPTPRFRQRDEIKATTQARGVFGLNFAGLGHGDVLDAKLYETFAERQLALAAMQWQHGVLSNYDYIMRLNVLAGRTFNDLSQYPVFPWVIADYTSTVLDLDKTDTYRDLSKPMGALHTLRRNEFENRYETLQEGLDMMLSGRDDLDEFPTDEDGQLISPVLANDGQPLPHYDPSVTFPFHYGTHYSNPTIVLHYLVRLQPFAGLHVQLQAGRFDEAERLFCSVADAWASCSGGVGMPQSAETPAARLSEETESTVAVQVDTRVTVGPSLSTTATSHGAAPEPDKLEVAVTDSTAEALPSIEAPVYADTPKQTVTPRSRHLMRLQIALPDDEETDATDACSANEGYTGNTQDVKELTPEWFTLPAMFENRNRYHLGQIQHGGSVDHVALPPWAHNSAERFVTLNRAALESHHVSKTLHGWIDLVFGSKQRGQAAADACNVFRTESYPGVLRDKDISSSVRAMIQEFGQTPAQLFRNPHPIRSMHCIPRSLGEFTVLERITPSDAISSLTPAPSAVVSRFCCIAPNVLQRNLWAMESGVPPRAGLGTRRRSFQSGTALVPAQSLSGFQSISAAFAHHATPRNQSGRTLSQDSRYTTQSGAQATSHRPTSVPRYRAQTQGVEGIGWDDSASIGRSRTMTHVDSEVSLVGMRSTRSLRRSNQRSGAPALIIRSHSSASSAFDGTGSPSSTQDSQRAISSQHRIQGRQSLLHVDVRGGIMFVPPMRSLRMFMLPHIVAGASTARTVLLAARILQGIEDSPSLSVPLIRSLSGGSVGSRRMPSGFTDVEFEHGGYVDTMLREEESGSFETASTCDMNDPIPTPAEEGMEEVLKTLRVLTAGGDLSVAALPVGFAPLWPHAAPAQANGVFARRHEATYVLGRGWVGGGPIQAVAWGFTDASLRLVRIKPRSVGTRMAGWASTPRSNAPSSPDDSCPVLAGDVEVLAVMENLHSSPVCAVAVCDRRWLLNELHVSSAVASESHEEVRSGRASYVPVVRGPSNPPSAVQSDGICLATAGLNDCCVRIWRLDPRHAGLIGEVNDTAAGKAGSTASNVRQSTDQAAQAQLLAAAGAVATPVLLVTYHGHESAVRSMAIDSALGIAVSCDTMGAVHLWNVDSGELRAKLLPSLQLSFPVSELLIDAIRRIIVLTSGVSLWVWDVSGRLLCEAAVPLANGTPAYSGQLPASSMRRARQMASTAAFRAADFITSATVIRSSIPTSACVIVTGHADGALRVWELLLATGADAVGQRVRADGYSRQYTAVCRSIATCQAHAGASISALGALGEYGLSSVDEHGTVVWWE